MVLDGTMKGDDEELTFISLAALTANVTRYLRLDKNEDKNTANKSDRSDAPKDGVPDKVMRKQI